VSNDALARLRIELPESERGRGAFDLRELDRINARLERNAYRPARGKTALDQREDDLARREALERQPGLKADGKWQREAVAETQALAEARGEEVSEDRSGVKRILDRDPLLSLARAGALTNEQLEAALAVRELYDLRVGDAASAPFDGMPAGSHDHERFVSNRFIRAKATVPAGQLETAILNGHFRTRDGHFYVLKCWPDLKAVGMEPHISLRVLRWVCCEHNTLTSMGRGRAYDRHRKALVWALDVADEVLDGRRQPPNERPRC
jgi:hypothetical protein